MTKKRAKQIAELLDGNYHETKSYLNYNKPYELLIAAMLSAQCTDDRVNKVTARLFKKYPDIESFAGANQNGLSKDIYEIGFHNAKAKNIILAMQMLKDNFGGEMPSDIEELKKMPGVGRKTANVIRAHIFDIPCVIVDTHVGRVSRRLGLSKETDPEKVEYDLMKLLPGEYWIKANLQMIAHGRKVCKAQKPLCGECFLGRICEYDLRHLLDKGMSSMKTGNGRPAKEVFDNIKKEYGFDKK